MTGSKSKPIRAYAGINPSATVRYATKATLLPPRGHQPWRIRYRRRNLRTSPPKPRGSTHNTGRGQPQQFPPHAGINHIPAGQPNHRSPTPCPHAGINPSHQNNPPRGRHIPPHTRGSTIRIRTIRPAAGTFPAHAGINPAFAKSPRITGNRRGFKNPITPRPGNHILPPTRGNPK